MAHEPQWLRQTGRILSSLLQADEEKLADYVRERLDGADVPPERAADARALLIQIGEALREPTPERLMSLEYTRRVLSEWEVGEDKEAPPPEAVAPSAPPAAPIPAAAPPVIFVPGGNPTAPSPWAPQEQPPRADPMSSTVDGSTPPAASEPLPFSKGKSAAPKKLSLEPHAEMGQTAPIGKSRPKNVLPFGGKKPPLTLEQYAYFCVERTMWPEHQTQTCTKYGVDVDGEATLHEEYRKVLSVDNALQTKFNALREQARTQLSR